MIKRSVPWATVLVLIVTLVLSALPPVARSEEPGTPADESDSGTLMTNSGQSDVDDDAEDAPTPTETAIDSGEDDADGDGGSGPGNAPASTEIVIDDSDGDGQDDGIDPCPEDAFDGCLDPPTVEADAMTMRTRLTRLIRTTTAMLTTPMMHQYQPKSSRMIATKTARTMMVMPVIRQWQRKRSSLKVIGKTGTAVSIHAPRMPLMDAWSHRLPKPIEPIRTATARQTKSTTVPSSGTQTKSMLTATKPGISVTPRRWCRISATS